MQMLGQVLPSVVASVDQTSSFGRSAARQAMTDLHHCSKEVDYSDTLMVGSLVYTYNVDTSRWRILGGISLFVLCI